MIISHCPVSIDGPSATILVRIVRNRLAGIGSHRAVPPNRHPGAPVIERNRQVDANRPWLQIAWAARMCFNHQ
jgi:hypothetical protein